MVGAETVVLMVVLDLMFIVLGHSSNSILACGKFVVLVAAGGGADGRCGGDGWCNLGPNCMLLLLL